MGPLLKIWAAKQGVIKHHHRIIHIKRYFSISGCVVRYLLGCSIPKIKERRNYTEWQARTVLTFLGKAFGSWKNGVLNSVSFFDELKHVEVEACWFWTQARSGKWVKSSTNIYIMIPTKESPEQDWQISKIHCNCLSAKRMRVIQANPQNEHLQSLSMVVSGSGKRW